jgi:hypothetical protein
VQFTIPLQKLMMMMSENGEFTSGTMRGFQYGFVRCRSFSSRAILESDARL